MLILTAYLFFLGICIGSFLNVLVWRMKRKKNWVSERSKCDHCGHILAVRDLVPLLSWFSLGGKCRYCHKKLSKIHPLVELISGSLFVISYLVWPQELNSVANITEFVVWLILLSGFVALCIFDIKWMILPNKIIFALLVIVLAYKLVEILIFDGKGKLFWETLWGIMVGGGLFYILFQLSKGKWIGGGDVKLGFIIGAFVGGPLAAALAIFVASIVGTIASLPLLLSKRAYIGSKIPFGPFLMFGCLFVVLFGTSVLTWLKHDLFLLDSSLL